MNILPFLGYRLQVFLVIFFISIVRKLDNNYQMSLKKELINETINLSIQAGNAIMDIYDSDNISSTKKEDLSPLTEADLLSNEIILKGLKKIFPSIPILSEESSNIGFKERSKWKRYWLVDPLDGTKEFLKRNGEFTVNIALIEYKKPIFGVVYAPFLKTLYWGSKDHGSYEIIDKNKARKISVSKKNKFRIASSRSHQKSSTLESFFKKDEYTIIKKGSSLKFCLVANGNIDIYPRIGPTSEWDLAAGHAVVKYAGGVVLDFKGKEITYNKKNLINPDFIVCRSKGLALEIEKMIKNEE